MLSNTKKIHKLSVFIFRRDLRLEDNTGLLHALKLSEQVVPCFIFDKDQIDPSKNVYFSHNCVQFMIESLQDLNSELRKQKSRLFLFHGEKKEVFNDIMKNIKPNAVFVNEDYTAYSKQRDEILEDLCAKNGGKFYSDHDYTLLPKGQVLLPDKGFYKKFSAYYNHAKEFKVREPEENTFKNYYPGEKSFKGEFEAEKMKDFYKQNDRIEVNGGRKEGLKILENMKKWKDYGQKRDFISYPTTKLSAYNKFGCVSIREVYQSVKKALGSNAELIRQLFWRDFYYYVAYYHPHVFGDAFKEQYQKAYFSSSNELFDKWKEGKTGCPIVDAAMRQLNTKGYMTNRLRLITSNYLIKDLLVDWRKGEQYFAQNLVDYDPSQNNGNWQWSAGSGADSQPYFRIFNPKLQSEKYDKDCKYILEWVPELKNVEHKHIHHWDEFYKQYKGKVKYPDPIVIHDVQKKKCLELYKDLLSGNRKGYKEEDKIEDEDITTENEGKEEEDVIEKNERKRKREDAQNHELKKLRLNEDEAKKKKIKDEMEIEKLKGRTRSKSAKKEGLTNISKSNGGITKKAVKKSNSSSDEDNERLFGRKIADGKIKVNLRRKN